MQETILPIEQVTFSVVDQARRTIRGLVVPWNGVSSPDEKGRRFRFSRESLKAAAAKFVRLFHEHSYATAPFGRGLEMTPTDEGLEMTFQVYEGQAGDEFLQLAASGAKTGLSIGAEFDDSDIQPDPENPGAFLVNLANFLEVSLCKDPSFPQARVATVMFSAHSIGEKMEDIKTDEVVEETTSTEPAQVQLSTNDVEAIVRRLQNEQEKPVPVVPRATASTIVNEPANYVFSKNGVLENGKHDFGMDMIRGLNPQFNDVAARARAEEFVNSTFASIVRSDVEELSPARALPRYIDQKDYRTPVFEAIRKGTVPNGITPITYLKRNSSSGLVAQGTEGNEPTEGTYTTALDTVTPTTLRGKAIISREVWDIGGVPNIGNLIWTQMVRDYREASEANVVATLNAATPTSLGTFTAGGGTEGRTLVSQLRSNLAALQFARGGFRMGYLFAQADLYLALVGALDTTGRPLLPAIGATNADGTVAPTWNYLNINGVIVIPTWALAASGQTTAQSSYLVDPDAVDGWLDQPRKLVFEYQVSNIHLGIWGYVATAINDITGVREVLYDPTV